MYLIEILLPTFDITGQAFPKSEFEHLRAELIEHFGGVTAFVRSPAVGLWEDAAGDIHRDDVVIFEVMAEALDRSWWDAYRRQLERRFRQQEIVIRATVVDRL